MKQEDKYLRLIAALKKNQPTLSDKSQLTDEVMQKIRASKPDRSLLSQLDDILFDWVKSFRWRLVMATASFFLVGFFIHQQVIMDQRLYDLENQLSSAVSSIGYRDDEPGIMQKVLIKMALKDKASQDSITVSVQDMETLLRDYIRMIDENESLKHNPVTGSFFKKSPNHEQIKGKTKDL